MMRKQWCYSPTSGITIPFLFRPLTLEMHKSFFLSRSHLSVSADPLSLLMFRLQRCSPFHSLLPSFVFCGVAGRRPTKKINMKCSTEECSKQSVVTEELYVLLNFYKSLIPSGCDDFQYKCSMTLCLSKMTMKSSLLSLSQMMIKLSSDTQVCQD